MTRNKLALSLAGLLFAPIAGTAFAQSAPAAATQDQGQNTKQLQTITVTGSALPRVDTETPSPVTVITAQQIARSGFTTISDVVRSISADNSGTIPTSFTAGFAAGSSGVALRGLTVNSTLVLIDGHRVANYALPDDGERSFVDLNSIPMNAVERIEVLKDGASSLYGADAIAGVVNIILKSNFQGVEASAEVGTSQHGGGFTRRATFLAGGGDLQKDGHNAYVNVEYQQDNPIYNRNRSFPYNTSNLSSIGGNNLIGGQPGNNSGSIYGTVRPGQMTASGAVVAAPGTPTQILASGGCGPAASLVTNDPNNPGSYCAQNFISQYGEIAPEVKRGGISGRFTVKLSDVTTAYLDASYFQTEVVSTNGAPPQIQAGFQHNTNGIALPPTLANGQLNPNNPYAASGQYALINYAFGDLPNQGSFDNTNHNFRLTTDVTTTVGGWHLDTSVMINHTWLDIHNKGFINYNQLISDINTGAYNFVNPSANSASTRGALAPTIASQATTDLDSIDFRASRELWDLPGGALGLATGAEVRHEAQNSPQLNPLAGAQSLGLSQTIGRRNVAGAYVEVDAPVLTSLELDASGRFDHYSDFGNNFAPKVGFKWQPSEMIAVRGTFSKGFRAPSFAENGSSEAEGFVTYTPPASLAAAHGNNAYVNPYTLGQLSTANPAIKPEKSTSFTFGTVFQPLHNLSLSLDYFQIKKTNVIVQASPNAALAAYAAGQPLPAGTAVIADLPDPQFPNALPRPLIVEAPYINANSLKTKGVDLNVHFEQDIGGGVHWSSDVNATDIFTWKQTQPDGTVMQFVGTHGPFSLSSGAGTPRLRGSWANTFTYGPATVTGTFYYTSGESMTSPDLGPGCQSVNTATGMPFPSSCYLSSFLDFDLTGRYDINQHVALTASIMNVFDRKAPLDPMNYAANNYNPTYDMNGVIGRFFNLGVKVKF
ncbi:TonB-dependent receptor [Dyella choica]|uniref:TonB-dependent receptor n=1 Tax=Dyella choica TaxID=1927959 RepID=A0A432M0T6_9GAMM|nr:TonB-dependent receptor [Dyella choica]RUL70386.1 TonB-dependent receptor [Dyella choica]